MKQRQFLPPPVKSRRAAVGRRLAGPPLALLLLAAAAAPALAWEAPLDTLVTVDAPPPWIPQDIQISRKVLPQISGSTLPLVQPPARPPRLDDPAEAAWRFLQARRALAGGDAATALGKVREADERDPQRATYAWWRTWHALSRWNLDFLSALPSAWHATRADLVAWKRLLLLGHETAVLWLAVFWTALVAAFAFRWGGRLRHDLAALLLRDRRHLPRAWPAWLGLALLLLLRPGWFVLLGALSVPLFLHAGPRARALLAGVWALAAAALYPGLAPLRDAVPAIDPASETVLLTRAAHQPPAAATIRELESRLATAGDDPARLGRLRLALAIQAARSGDYDASARLFAAVLRDDPGHVAALVGLANANYYLGRYDTAVAGYAEALRRDPARGEVHYNLSQAYNKKLFFRESSEALARANALGFAPAPWEDAGAEANGFSPVVYLGHRHAELEASARWEAERYPPLAHLAAWQPWFGATPGTLGYLLGGLLALAAVLRLWLPARLRCVPCANCGAPVCPACSQAHEEGALCGECHGTAERARSELVLATLLKNRSRDQEMAFGARAQRFNRLLPGASNLVAGQPALGLVRLSLFAAGASLVLFGWSFNLMAAWDLPGLVLPEETLHPQLLPLPASAWSGPRAWSLAAGLLLLAALYASAGLGRETFRRSGPSRMAKQILRPENWRAPGAPAAAPAAAAAGPRAAAAGPAPAAGPHAAARPRGR